MAATEPHMDDGPPLTELESLQLKANQVTDESLESTRRMIQLCEDSRGAGIKTMEMLDHQGEQLRRVEDGLDQMNAEMKEAEKHLTGMEKWCGLCVCPWNRAPKVRDMDASWSKPTDGGKGVKGDSEEPDWRAAIRKQPQGQGGSSGPPARQQQQQQYIKRINNDAREDEMEDNMQVVGSILGDLKTMAKGMGDEISKQNQQIDRMTSKGEHVDVRITNANKRTEKLLK